MSPEDFISGMREISERGAVRGVVDNLLDPPGRRPSERLISLSRWFAALGEQERARVEEVLTIGTAQALYNVLLVLDGTMPFNVDGETQEFELYARHDGRRVLLNDPTRESLADLFKSQEQ